MTMERREETAARLRKQLKREPTEAEVTAAQDLEWRKRLSDMAFTAHCFADEEIER
jgi:hypothetical protein